MEVRKRFKGLDLIHRVPEELWNEVRDIVKETGIKIIPKKNKCKKAKWLSEEALQIAEKEEKLKAKKKMKDIPICMQSSKEQQIDKKDFLSDQCKEIEENNRMGKTRDLIKKIRNTKGDVVGREVGGGFMFGNACKN